MRQHAEVEDCCCTRPAKTGHEVISDGLALGVDVMHDQRGVYRQEVRPARDERETPSSHMPAERRSARHQHLVACAGRFRRQRQQGLQVTLTSSRRE